MHITVDTRQSFLLSGYEANTMIIMKACYNVLWSVHSSNVLSGCYVNYNKGPPRYNGMSLQKHQLQTVSETMQNYWHYNNHCFHDNIIFVVWHHEGVVSF